MSPDPNDRPQAFFDALDVALRARESGEFDAGSFRADHPEFADDVLAELEILDRLESPGAMMPGSPIPSDLPGAADHDRTVEMTPDGSGETRVRGASAVPDRLGDFEITGEIGRGGMGVVYAAKQAGLDRDVAVKLLPPGFAADKKLRRRFEREAELAARLVHPGIVRIYAFGEEADILYLAMERIDGASLQSALVRIPERTAEALADAVGAEPPGTAGLRGYVDAIAKIGATVADALHDAHGHGLVHRDVKPGNILLDRKLDPKLADFGLARAMDSQSLTASGHVLGTPGYLAPECIRGDAAGMQADVFALGATLYEALSGERVFDGQTTAEILNRVLNTDPPPLDQLDKRIPADLANVIQRSLEKEPKRRYADAAAFRDDLMRYLRGEPVSAVRVNMVGRAMRRARRRPRTAAVIVGGSVLLIALLSIWIVSTVQRSNSEARRHADLLERADNHANDDELQAALALYREASEIRPGEPRAADGVKRITQRIRTRRIARTRSALLGEIITADGPVTAETVRRLDAWTRESEQPRLSEILRAMVSFCEGDWANALDHIDRASTLGASLGTHFLRSYILDNLGRSKEASAARRQAKNTKPERIEDYIIAAGRMYQDSDREAAFDLLARGQRRYPDDPVLKQVHGWLLYRSWRHNEALAKLEQALLREPSLTAARVAKARSLLELKRFPEAEADFRQALEERPDYAEARVGLAESLFYAPSPQQKQNRAKAFEIIEAGLAKGDSAALFNIRGWFRAMIGQYKDAEADYRKAIAMSPNHIANVNLAVYLQRSNRIKEFEALIDDCLARPKFSNRFKISLLNARAIQYWGRDQAKAEKSLRAALAINRTPNIVANLGLLFIQQGRFSEAIPLLTEQIAGGYGVARALCRRGFCRFRLMDWRRAERDQDMGIDRATEVSPNQVERWMRTNRAFLHAARGNFQNAWKSIDDDAVLESLGAHLSYVDWRCRASTGDDVTKAIERVTALKRLAPPARAFLEAWKLGIAGDFTAAAKKLPEKLETVAWQCPDPMLAVAIQWGARYEDPAIQAAARRVLRHESIDAAALPALEDPQCETGRQWLIGRALLAKGQAREACAPLERAVEGLPYGDCAIDLATALLRSGAEKEGLAALDKARARGRENNLITWRLGAARIKPTDAIRAWLTKKSD